MDQFRIAYQELAAGGFPQNEINAMNDRIADLHGELQVRYSEQRSISKNLRRMNRATSVWSDRRNNLRELAANAHAQQALSPQEVQLRPKVETPVSGAMRMAP